MLKELNRLTLPVAISIASFDGTYFIAAGFFELTQREMILGLVAGAVSRTGGAGGGVGAVGKTCRAARDLVLTRASEAGIHMLFPRAEKMWQRLTGLRAGQVRGYRHRIRDHRLRAFHCDRRRSQRHRHQAQHHVWFGLDPVEIADRPPRMRGV